MSQPVATTSLEIYQCYILLLKISPTIWRRVQVCTDSTLAHLHQLIRLTMGWQNAYLNRFVIHAHEYTVTKPGGNGRGANGAERVKLNDLQLRKDEWFIH